MRGFTRYLRRSRVFLRATEGDFIDICVVRGMFCVVSEGFHSLFTSFGDFLDICIVAFWGLRMMSSTHFLRPFFSVSSLASYVTFRLVQGRNYNCTTIFERV